MPDFIPRQNIQAATWGRAFTLNVAAQAERLSLSPQRVADLEQRQARFAEAVRVANEPGTRTAVTIEAQREARSAFERLAREIAAKARVVMTRAELVGMGLATGPGRGASRRRVPKPATAPVLTVRRVDGSRVTLHLRNADTPSRRGMDRDIAAAHIFSFAGPDYPADPSAWRHMGATTRALTTINFGHRHPPGTQVWITAEWVNRRHERGARALPVMTFLGYCGAVRRAA